MPNVLFSFNYTNGGGPWGPPVFSSNVLYGVTFSGNTNADANEPDTGTGTGTIFRINADGSGFANLYNFSTTINGTNTDGTQPTEGLTLDGNTLYGTAQSGGLSDEGTIFKINTDGSGFTTLHSFLTDDLNDGIKPFSLTGLVVANGTIYGMANDGALTGGMIFKINTNGTSYTDLHDFDPTFNDGVHVGDNGLTIQGGTLFGATIGGGNLGTETQVGGGTVFSLSTNGEYYQVLYNFPMGPDEGVYGTNSVGSNPYYGVVVEGNSLYGTTMYGGLYGYGTLFTMNTDGTGFTVLMNFTNAYSGGNLIATCSSLFGQYGSQLFSVNLDGTGFQFLTTNLAPHYIGNNFVGAGITLSGNTIYGPGTTNAVGDAPTLSQVSGSILATPADLNAISQPEIDGLSISNAPDQGFIYTVALSWGTRQTNAVTGVPQGAMYELQDFDGYYIFDDVFAPVTAESLSAGIVDAEITFPECYPDPQDPGVYIRIRYVNCGIYGPWSDSFAIGPYETR